MMNVLIILVMVVVVAFSAVFAGVTFLQGVRSSVELQITKQRLLEVASAIQTQARYINGVYALPAGTQGAAPSPYLYNQVPGWITTNAKSAHGVPFVYCPYAAVTGVNNATIYAPSGGSYGVQTASNDTTAGQPYVIASAPAPTAITAVGATGVLIAAAPQNYNPPDCSSITAAAIDATTPLVSGGVVMPIGDNYLNKMQTGTVTSELSYYIGDVASGATGDLSGRDPSNLATLSAILTAIEAAKPSSAYIIFPSAAATYDISGNATVSTSLNNILVNGTRLGFMVAGAGYQATAIFKFGSGTIPEGNHIGIRNMTLQSTGTLEVRGQLDMDNDATIKVGNALYINGGTVVSSTSNNSIIDGNVTIDGGGRLQSARGYVVVVNNITNRGFKILNGAFDGYTISINTAAGNGFTPLLIGAGGALRGGYVYITTSNGGGAIVEPGGLLFEQGGTLQIYYASLYGIYLHGRLNVNPGLSIPTQGAGGLQYGLILASGAKAYTPGPCLVCDGYNPMVGIYDAGGFSIDNEMNTGGTVYAGTKCWQGNSGFNLFSDNNDNGTTLNAYGYTKNTAGLEWLRLYNSSIFQCQGIP